MVAAPEASEPATATGNWSELTRPWKAAAGVLALSVVVLMVGAFVNSFAAVEQAVRPSFGELAWTVPLLVDLGIVVFSGLDLVLTKIRLRVWWLRTIPLLLIAATVYLNIVGETSAIGVVAHAVAPALWVVPVELAAHAIRTEQGLDAERAARRAAGKLDKVRISRWLLAPVSTAVIRRQMVLHEERSYDVARQRWYERQEAKWTLQDHYRWLWRVRATRRERGLYRWGYLTADMVGRPSVAPVDLTDPDARTSHTGGQAETGRGPTTGPQPTGDSATGTRPKRSKAGRRRKRRATEVIELMPDVRLIAGELEATGQPMTKESLGEALRADGWQVANDRVREALHLWRSERQSLAPATTNGQAAGPETTSVPEEAG